MWKIKESGVKCKYQVRPFLFILFAVNKERCLHPENPEYNMWIYPPCNEELCPIKDL